MLYGHRALMLVQQELKEEQRMGKKRDQPN